MTILSSFHEIVLKALLKLSRYNNVSIEPNFPSLKESFLTILPRKGRVEDFKGASFTTENPATAKGSSTAAVRATGTTSKTCKTASLPVLDRHDNNLSNTILNERVPELKTTRLVC